MKNDWYIISSFVLFVLIVVVVLDMMIIVKCIRIMLEMKWMLLSFGEMSLILVIFKKVMCIR